MRRPVSALRLRVFPSLAVAVAAGALTGCESPRCSESRAAELLIHGPNATAALSRGDPLASARQLALGLGLGSHPLPLDTSDQLGTSRVVTHAPPLPVTPQPVTPPVHAVSPPGRMRAVQPHPVSHSLRPSIEDLLRQEGHPARVHPGARRRP